MEASFLRIFPVYLEANHKTDINTPANVTMIREAAQRDVRVHQLILCVATILDNLLFVVEEQLP